MSNNNNSSASNEFARIVADIEFETQCGVCYGDAAIDPVSMTCKAQHLYCFPCVFQYYKCKVGNLDTISCPHCRHGNGSLIVHRKMAKALKPLDSVCRSPCSSKTHENDEEEQSKPASDDYFAALPDLTRRFPRTFRYSLDSCIITTDQMMYFVNNYEALRNLRLYDPASGLPEPGVTWRNLSNNIIPSRRSSSRRDTDENDDGSTLNETVSREPRREQRPNLVYRRSDRIRRRMNGTSTLPHYTGTINGDSPVLLDRFSVNDDSNNSASFINNAVDFMSTLRNFTDQTTSGDENNNNQNNNNTATSREEHPRYNFRSLGNTETSSSSSTTTNEDNDSDNDRSFVYLCVLFFRPDSVASYRLSRSLSSAITFRRNNLWAHPHIDIIKINLDPTDRPRDLAATDISSRFIPVVPVWYSPNPETLRSFTEVASLYDTHVMTSIKLFIREILRCHDHGSLTYMFCRSFQEF